MRINPFEYALKKIALPIGNSLWLNGEVDIATGDAYQVWSTKADLLKRKGHQVFSDTNSLASRYDSVFINCPKQLQEAEGLIALAFDLSPSFVMAAAAKDAGGERLAGIMKKYGVPVEQTSKSHYKITWTTKAKQADKKLAQENKHYLEPSHITIEDSNWWTVPGLFGWNKIDEGSKILAQHLPLDLQGKVADFGCGYGYLTSYIRNKFSSIRCVDAYDADMRAIACCKLNNPHIANVLWKDIQQLDIKHHYDAVIMNPPFHTNKNEDTALGQIFIQKAWQSLKPKGRLFMVANSHLPYEKLIQGFKILYEGSGYKVITGQHE